MTKFNLRIITKIAILIIVLITFFFFVLRIFSTAVNDSFPVYHAVFLTNGQVYFGRIKELNAQVLTLQNVYYLRANTSLQNPQSEDQKQEANVELSLIKLGNELHGPKDTMMINRTNILFWEELREDGKVVQAIKRYSL